MIKKRIIPKILLQESDKTGKICSVTSTKHSGTKNVGDPESQSGIYQSTISDELMVLVSRHSNIEFQKTLMVLEKICSKAFMPISFGGAISNMRMVNQIFEIGIEKVIFGRAIHQNKNLLEETADKYGSQAVVASLDFNSRKELLITEDGKTNYLSVDDLENEIRQVEEIGVGEICLSYVDLDGSMKGSNLLLLEKARKLTDLPLIQNCGIGNTRHFVEAFACGADAVAAGSYFSFQDQNFIEIRSHIRNSGIDIRA